MVSDLQDKGEKYPRAINGQGWASFSIIGTEDWKDYASLSLAAMQTETLSDLGERPKRIERLLLRIVRALEKD